jgi:sulfur carrier protein ThiS
MDIHLMFNTASFVLTNTDATTVGGLIEELDIPSSSTVQVNIDGVVVGHDTPLVANAIVAVVAKDKVGG